MIKKKILIVSDHRIGWLDEFTDSCTIDLIKHIDDSFEALRNSRYDILILDDQIIAASIFEIIEAIKLTDETLSIVVLTNGRDMDYHLDLIEGAVDEVLCKQDDEKILIRRMKLVIKENDHRYQRRQHNQYLHSAAVLSRRLHNADHPTTLIIDAINLVTSTLNLQGLIIALIERDSVHLYAGTNVEHKDQMIYDVVTKLHKHNPIQQAINSGLIQVYECLSENKFMIDIPIFESFGTAIIVPLRSSNVIIGSIVALGSKDNVITNKDLLIYEHLATHLGSAYQNVRQYYAQDINVKANRHLLRTWQRLSNAYSADEIGQEVQKVVADVISVRNVVTWVYTIDKQPVVNATTSSIVTDFNRAYDAGVIDEFIAELDIQMQSTTLWMGRSTNRSLSRLFEGMEVPQLIIIPIHDLSHLYGGMLVGVSSQEELAAEYVNLLESIAYAASQTLARNMLITSKQEQTERLETILRGIKDGVFFVTDSQEVVFCNPQFSDLTGITPSQIMYNSVEILLEQLIIRSDNSKQTRNQLKQAVKDVVHSSDNQEYPIIELYLPELENNLYIEFVTMSAGVRNEDQPRGWLGFIQKSSTSDSITTTDTLGIRHIRETMQSSLVALYTQFSGLNDPNVLLSQRQDRQLRTMIQSDISRLLSFWGNLHYLSDIEKDQIEFSREAIRIDDLLKLILGDRVISTHNHRITVAPIPDDLELYSDYKYIQMILSNTIKSVIDLSDDRSAILIEVRQNKDMVRINVQNSGMTLDKHYISNLLTDNDIFEDDDLIFSYIALYISHQLTLMLGGIYDFDDQSENYFQIQLPLQTKSIKAKPEELTNDVGNGVPERKLSTIMVYDKRDSVAPLYSMLNENDYEVIYCYTTDQVYNEIDLVRVDVLILTIYNQNKVLDLIHQLRHDKQSKIPIIVVSNDSYEQEKLKVLKLGSDAYIDLNSSQEELTIILENIFRRSKLHEQVHEPLIVGKFKIDFAKRQVFWDNQLIDLTRIEYELLCLLAINEGTVLSHDELLRQVWGPEYRDEKQYLWVNVSRLRRKLDSRSDNIKYIYTQPGVGYIFRVPQ